MSLETIRKGLSNMYIQIKEDQSLHEALAEANGEGWNICGVSRIAIKNYAGVEITSYAPPAFGEAGLYRVGNNNPRTRSTVCSVEVVQMTSGKRYAFFIPAKRWGEK